MLGVLSPLVSGRMNRNRAVCSPRGVVQSSRNALRRDSVGRVLILEPIPRAKLGCVACWGVILREKTSL